MERHSPFAPSYLPKVRGRYRYRVPMAKTMWFQVGGPADIVFRPEDVEDLQSFLRHYEGDLPLFAVGAGSNLLVRDGGMRAIVIRGGRGFTDISSGADGVSIYAGSSVLAPRLASFAASCGIAGLEFMAGIPGSIGGLCAMNAGAYGSDISTVLTYADILTSSGEALRISADDAGFSYRGSSFPQGSFITGACFTGVVGDKTAINARIAEIMEQRHTTQPVKGRTGGSTFRNPEGHHAWQLIDAAGCRGLTEGGAQISELHCNFMLNSGRASAENLETLGEIVRDKVKKTSGITLEWEIKRVGELSPL